MLEVRSLNKTFGARHAIKDFTHRFADGKITTILGPSGSGKSTALALTAGLKEPDSGTVLLNGHDITALPPERRGFGVVFQNYSLFPHLDVIGNVEFGLRVRRIGKAERRRRALEALKLARIEELANRHITQISGGEQQRVALARAIAFSPSILLMDEPLSALDAKLREELREELLRLLATLAITTIYVTHDQIEAMSLGSEMIILNDGAIEQSGPPAQLYLRPANLFVATFLGDSNVFPAECEDGSGGLRLPFAAINAVPNRNGPKCWAMVRPDAMELVEPSDADFSAVVESSTFMGNHLRLRLRAGSDRVILDTQNRRPFASDTPVYVRIKREEISTWPR